MTLFHHIQFAKVDPLADGLGDEIAAERAEPEAIVLTEDVDESLADKWQAIVEDAMQDPDYVDMMRSIDE